MPVIDAQSAAALMDPLTALVAKAGAAVLSVNRGRMMIGGKVDGSPVTDADLASDRIIAEGTRATLPRYSGAVGGARASRDTALSGSFFVIDPLDGTKEFIAGRDEFTVNLAIVTDGVPLFGIIGAPALGSIWRGLVGHGAQRLAVAPDGGVGAAEPIATRPFPGPGSQWVAAVSRSHGDSRSDAFIERRPGAVRKPLGSAVKFCRIAEGGADIYPTTRPDRRMGRCGRSRSGHRRRRQGHGRAGAPLHFGRAREGFLVPEFIAWGDPSAAPRG